MNLKLFFYNIYGLTLNIIIMLIFFLFKHLNLKILINNNNFIEVLIIVRMVCIKKDILDLRQKIQVIVFYSLIIKFL